MVMQGGAGFNFAEKRRMQAGGHSERSNDFLMAWTYRARESGGGPPHSMTLREVRRPLRSRASAWTAVASAPLREIKYLISTQGVPEELN
jgi:hypothetical protein